jgi:pyridoxal phosphate enzyme (YggS family)
VLRRGPRRFCSPVSAACGRGPVVRGTVEELQLGGSYRERLATTLPRVRERIEQAACQAGRDPAAITLVAVTKGHPVEALRAALAAGIRDLGENRVAELEEKVGLMGRDAARWHMIGHVQSRKAPRVVDCADLVHSVDSTRLATRLSSAALEQNRRLRVLVQVNTSGEDSKSGFEVQEALEATLELAELPGLEVCGLMTMAPMVDDEQVLGTTFARLRETLEQVRRQDPRVGGDLSMGMTNDLEIAVREGSTLVRIGTALFGERVR